MFSKFVSGESNLTSKANLLNGVPSVVASVLSGKKSANRTYSIWVYMNTCRPDVNKMIIGRAGDIVLYLDANSSVLKCKIKPSTTEVANANGTATSINSNVVDIVNNFPIQKWVFITVAVDSGGVCDYYLDGKLVKSVKTTDTTIDGASEDAPIMFGNGHDTYIADLKRVPKTKGPQDVWNAYSSGNSGSNIQSAVGNYNVNLSILKDNVATSSYSLV
jgi:hypothetical protein